MTRPLAGRHVVTTRDGPSRLDSLLARAGADVIRIPLIEIAPPPDEGAELDAALADLDAVDWIVVTSHHGARRVGPALADRPGVSLAAVGATTAAVLGELAGRAVDVVPTRQRAADLLAAMPPGPGTVLVAQADRADALIVEGLAHLGYTVRAVTAYRTLLRTPSWRERHIAVGADAVVFASGSATSAWVAAFGPEVPAVSVAIGPTTAAAGRAAGLLITHVATDHDLDGLAAATIAALTDHTSPELTSGERANH